jgi:hypothetical protein
VSAADWKPYDVPGLAALLAEQPTDSGTHAMAWQQAYETLTDQRQRIEAARAALAQAWPATPGNAAGSFFDQVDALTQAMSASAETAVNAHGALTGIVTVGDGATAKMDTLHQSWQENQATIGDVVPTDDWTQPLNDQAHTVMGQADAAIAEHATHLVPPPKYVAGVSHETQIPLSTSSSGSPGGRTGTVPQQSFGRSAPTSRLPGTPVLTSSPSMTSGTGPSRALTNRALDTAGTPVSIAGIQDRVANGPTGTPQSTDSARPSSGDASAGRNGQLAESDDASAGATRSDDHSASRETLGSRSHIAAPEGPSGARGRRSPHNSNSSNAAGAEEFGTVSGNRVVLPKLGRAHVETMFDGSVRTDADARLSPELATGASPRLAGSSEPIPYAGMLAAGTSAPGVGGARGRPDARGTVEWLIPTGGRPIIEPGPEVAVRHDPGPGVIGIDL